MRATYVSAYFRATPASVSSLRRGWLPLAVLATLGEIVSRVRWVNDACRVRFE